MNTRRLGQILVLAAVVLTAACKTTSVASPPSIPSATPSPAGLPAPSTKPEPASGTPSTTPPSSGSPAPADQATKPDGQANDANPQTSEERRVAVAKRLDDSLGTWDATLRKEQSDLAKAREQRTDDAAKSADAKSGEGVDDVDADAGVDPEKEVAKNERKGGMKSEADAKKDPKGSGDNGAEQQGDVGQGRVDDIVGRQICEAAQTETDPELKQKLQKECQKYRDATH
jgi:hypothetical protein